MNSPAEIIKSLQLEVDFYKRQLNDITGGIISRDYKLAEMSNELKQMRKGFALIADLNQFKPVPVFEEIYDHFTEEINIQMQMDLSLVLLPVPGKPSYFSPKYFKGVSVCDADELAWQKIFIPSSFTAVSNSLLVNSQTENSPLIETLRQCFGISFFIVAPVLVKGNVIAYLFTGRRIETTPLAASRLLIHDVHALEAIAGVIAAIKNQHDQFLLLENERTRIAREMHDDIGAEITKIRFFSQALTAKAVNGTEEKKKLLNINIAAAKMWENVNEIIWTMNCRNDNLSNLAAYIRSYAAEYLQQNDICARLHFDAVIPELFISNSNRRNIFLVVKEALHNIVKHASAKVVTIHFNYAENLLRIILEDDGIGLCSKQQLGNGLVNMSHRMSETGGTFTIDSKPGEGTTIVLNLALAQQGSVTT